MHWVVLKKRVISRAQPVSVQARFTSVLLFLKVNLFKIDPPSFKFNRLHLSKFCLITETCSVKGWSNFDICFWSWSNEVILNETTGQLKGGKESTDPLWRKDIWSKDDSSELIGKKAIRHTRSLSTINYIAPKPEEMDLYRNLLSYRFSDRDSN